MGDHRTALVTGAAQGIGAAVAAALASDGVTVAAADANATALAATARALGPLVRPYVLDVRDASAVEDVVDRVERESGPIDILVNVAGILRTGPITELSDQDWADVFAVNVGGVFHCSRAVANRMTARKRGTIVTVASNSAGVPRMNMGAYAASKAASTMFTKCLGLELAGHNIRCNVVCPGSTNTPMQQGMWEPDHGSDEILNGSLDTFRVGIPLRGMAEPSHIADAVLFLVSDRASHITMHDLYVDGGAALGV
jgi:2,3-dihydro-2,3-dihydroxybenzoate dehydrogenase